MICYLAIIPSEDLHEALAKNNCDYGVIAKHFRKGAMLHYKPKGAKLNISQLLLAKRGFSILRKHEICCILKPYKYKRNQIFVQSELNNEFEKFAPKKDNETKLEPRINMIIDVPASLPESAELPDAPSAPLPVPEEVVENPAPPAPPLPVARVIPNWPPFSLPIASSSLVREGVGDVVVPPAPASAPIAIPPAHLPDSNADNRSIYTKRSLILFALGSLLVLGASCYLLYSINSVPEIQLTSKAKSMVADIMSCMSNIAPKSIN